MRASNYFRMLLKLWFSFIFLTLTLTGCESEKVLEGEAKAAWRKLGKFTSKPSSYQQGIDVSHWNGAIDWPAVSSENIVFTYIKVSEGLTFIDKEFATNWAGTRENDIIRGGYHVFTPKDKGIGQANNFLNAIHTVHHGYIGALPPVLDIEQIPQDEIEASRPEIQAWLDTVEHALGCAPIIYTSPATWNEEYPGKFTTYRLWLADYDLTPTLPVGWKNWLFWQYTDTEDKAKNKGPKTGIQGKIRGIQGDTDLDFFNGRKSALIRSTCTGGL